MLNRVLQSESAQRAAAFVLAAYLRFALRTTRWVLDGGENLAPFTVSGGVVAAFWHECLPLMPALWMRVLQANPARDGRVLISLHRDGRFIADIMKRMRIGVVHGSTARARTHRAGGEKGARDNGGAAALRTLVTVLKQGNPVVLTPDGPRGPARVAAGGVAQMAALTGAPVLPCAARMRHHFRIPSWDRMIVPLPFGSGVLVCLPPIAVARDAWQPATAIITAALTQAADRAEALCR
jgi:lysophospholipid acyltransferase (LPLAT)-like uncharacterized protein